MPITAIKPKGFKVPQPEVLKAELTRFAKGVADETKRYPPWRPWKYPPKSGPHRGGRRTGDLGRSWQVKVELQGQGGYAEVASHGVRYAKYVQGSRQARFMAARDWRKITDIAKTHKADFHARMQKWAEVTVK